MKVNASSNSDTKTSASADGEVSANESPPQTPKADSSEGSTEGTKTLGGAPAEVSAGPAPSCPLVCYVANKGRLPPAEEQRLGGELANELATLRGCGSANARPSLTLRFDSSAKLTQFGIDAERGNEGACVNTMRDRLPAVTFQGPATLRCSEKCGGEPTRSARRRR